MTISKEYKEFYMPKGTLSIVTVLKMNYIAVRGSRDPNDADGENKQAIGLLYGIAFTIKMSKKEDCRILLPGKISTGLSEKLRQRRNRIFPRLCVQWMHIESYDDEPVTVDAMHRFMEEQGHILDITDRRMHHEIYLSDARKVAPEKFKTVIRHPIKRA